MPICTTHTHTHTDTHTQIHTRKFPLLSYRLLLQVQPRNQRCQLYFHLFRFFQYKLEACLTLSVVASIWFPTHGHTLTHTHTHTHTHPRVCTLINKTWYYWINSWMNRIYDIIYKSWWQMVGTVKRKGHTYSHTWWHSNQSDVSYYWIHSWMNRIYDRIYES